MRISSNGVRRGNMGTHHPGKEQASSRTNKDVREKTKFTDVIEQIRRRKWTRAGQGTPAGHEVTDGHCVSPPENTKKGKYLEQDRRDVGETNWTTTGRVPSGRG